MVTKCPMYDCYNTPFKWGSNDCMMMAANYYRDTFGVDYAEPYRGKYSTAIGAYRILSKMGGMQKFLTDIGFNEIPVAYGNTGDVALYKLDKQGFQMGVVNRGNVVFAGGIERPLLEMAHMYSKR